MHYDDDHVSASSQSRNIGTPPIVCISGMTEKPREVSAANKFVFTKDSALVEEVMRMKLMRRLEQDARDAEEQGMYYDYPTSEEIASQTLTMATARVGSAIRDFVESVRG